MHRLRSDVNIEPSESGAILTDSVTGFCVDVPVAPAALRDETFALGSEPGTTLASMGLLEEGLSAAQLRVRQRAFRRESSKSILQERIADLLNFATQKVPYYRERSNEYAAANHSSPDAFATLPIMTKATLRTHFPHGLVADGVDVASLLESGELEMAGTSGTTGERVQVFADMSQASVPDNYEELWNLAPTDEVPTTAVFTTPTCLGNQCHLGHAPYEERLRGDGKTLFLNSVEDLFGRLNDETVRKVVGEMQKFSPDFLLVNPFYGHWLLRRAGELNLSLPKPKLVLTCYQYLSEIQRRALQEGFGAPVYNYYFATDLSGCRIAIECPHGNWHVREDQTFLEVVGPKGPKPVGEVGTFALTALSNRVMPLVRYVVGDVGRLTAADCGCAVGDWATIEMHGRLKDVLFAEKGVVTTREIDQVVSRCDGLDFYKVFQTSPRQLYVEAVPSLARPFVKTQLVELLRDAFHYQEVKVREVRRLDPEASLKFRLTQSAVPGLPELL